MAGRWIETIYDIAHHRNGIGGEGFYALTFTDADGNAMVATVFDEPGTVAVLSLGGLAQGDIAYGTNSWRGDVYEPELRVSIQEWEVNRSEKTQ
jgi:hypothetical protein